MPMDDNFTRFLHYYQINTSDIDLFADAYGLDCCFNELVSGFKSTSKKPDDKIINKLLLDIDKAISKY